MTVINKQKQQEICRELIDSQWLMIVDDLNNKGGVDIRDFDELSIKHPGDKQINTIPLLLKHAGEKINSSIKEVIYRHIACANWLKGNLLIDVIDTLFEHFENDKMQFTHCDIEGAFEFILAINKDYEGVTSWDEMSTIEVRWAIGLAINALIKPRLVSHMKYQDRLQILIKNKKYRKGRSELILAYAKLGKQKAIPDLINLLDGWDLDILGRTIVALGKLKAKEAKPHLEKLLKYEDSYFRNLAKKALKKIG